MAKLRVTIHPLFFAFGLYFALIGKVFSFIIFVLTALIHEFGHYLASERCGYKLNRIMLMPYGAVISGDIDGVNYRDEIEIALAGPLINLLVVIAFVALWWVKPEIYAYTDEIVSANLCIATINFIPCYPLDGGRILSATLSLFFKRKTAMKVCRIIGIVLSAILFGLFIFSIFHKVNFSVLFFALFMLFGAISRSKENQYIRIFADLTQKKLKQGVFVKRVAISGASTLKQLYRLVGNDVCEVIVVDENGKQLRTLSFEKVKSLIESGDFYNSVENLLKTIA